MTVYQLLGSQANIRSLIFLKLEWWRQCNTHHLTLHFIHHVRGSCLCINVVILDRYKCMSKFTLRMHARTLFCSTLTILLSAHLSSGTQTCCKCLVEPWHKLQQRVGIFVDWRKISPQKFGCNPSRSLLRLLIVLA